MPWRSFIAGLVIGGITLVGVAHGVADYFGWRILGGPRKPNEVELGPMAGSVQQWIHDTDEAVLALLRGPRKPTEVELGPTAGSVQQGIHGTDEALLAELGRLDTGGQQEIQNTKLAVLEELRQGPKDIGGMMNAGRPQDILTTQQAVLEKLWH